MDLRKSILFYADLASFPVNGATGVLYVDKDTGFIYSWNGATYLAAGTGGLNYLGLWDANANSPAITSGVGSVGDYYIVGTAGTTNIDGISDWEVGDWIIFGGAAWQKIDNSEVNLNIYNSDGTLTGNRTASLDGHKLIFDNGSVGINATPSTALHVNALAVPSGEAVARFGVTDSSGYVQIANGTGTNNIFAPLLQGRQVGTSLHSAVGTEGIIDPVDDIGTSPITLFKARLSDFTSPLTRPLFQFTSWSFNVMTMLANGNVGIGTATPGEKLDVNGKTKTTTFQMTTTPTAGYVLTSDASGNGTWSAAAGGASGVFGIANTSGVYTFYATLTLAMAAATAGQTIEMFADITDATSTPVELKPYVNINGNGHTYNHTSNSGATFTITDTAGTKSGDINLYNLNIKRTTTASSGNPIFTASSSYTYLYNTFNFYGCKVSYTSTSGATPCFDGVLLSVATINGLDFTSNGSGNAISTAFICDVNNSIINCTGTSTGISGTGTVKNCIINVTSGIGINTSTPYECTVFASTSGTCFRTPVAYNCTAFSNTGYCFDGSYVGANTVYNCIARTTSGVGYWSSNCISSSAFATTGKTIDLHYNYGADAYKFYNNFFYASTAPAVDISSVTIMDSSIFCGWNSASGHGIRMSGTTGVISNNIIDVSNTSANCINSAAASTLKYSINTFKGATTPVNANITQGMINTQDNQGNILI